MPLSLIALAIAAFGVGTTEFVVMGLLPEVARDLGVEVPAAGLIVTAYAAGVVVGAPIMAILTNGLPRKASLLGLMAIFVAGNFLCAIAPGYGALIAARIITAFCHGAFFGIAAVVATDLVPKDRRAQAVALVFGGLTLANVLGVPGGTAIGQWFGWRVTFWGVAGIGLVAIAAIAAWLPSWLKAPRVSLVRELGVLRRPQVLMAMSMTVLTSASLFSVFTFIVPLLMEEAAMTPAGSAAALLLFGVGMTAGGFIGGRLADRWLMPTIMGSAAALILALGAFGLTSWTAAAAVPMMFILGLVIFSLAPPLQIRVVNTAIDAPNVASTLNQAAFNLGNASGAWIGSAALMLGASYAMLPWLAVTIAAPAFCIAFVSWRLDGRASAPAVRAFTEAM